MKICRHLRGLDVGMTFLPTGLTPCACLFHPFGVMSYEIDLIIIVMEKKEFWKFVVQTLLAVLTAIATLLGASSCINMICS